MFDNFPKLGRPFAAGFPRDKSLRFYLTIDELKSFEQLEKNVIIYYASKGAIYNRSVHLRAILNIFDDVRILNAVFSNPTRELQSCFDKEDFSNV